MEQNEHRGTQSLQKVPLIKIIKVLQRQRRVEKERSRPQTPSHRCFLIIFAVYLKLYRNLVFSHRQIADLRILEFIEEMGSLDITLVGRSARLSPAEEIAIALTCRARFLDFSYMPLFPSH